MTVAAFGVVKNTIRLRSGRYFDFLVPEPSQFTLADIGGALSKICRFGGQIGNFYSVAEHLINCVHQAMRDGHSLAVQQAVFLHDAAEAFVGDMVKPLKVMMPDYKVVEDRVEAVIAEKFHVDFTRHRKIISEIDHAMLIAERRALFTPDKVEWCGETQVRPLTIEFQCWTPREAEMDFEGRCLDLGFIYDV